MKKAREQSIHKRTIRALVIMAIMLGPVCVFMVLGGMRLAKDRESAQIKLKMDALAQLVDNENEMYNAAVEAFDKNLATHVNMMRVSLGNLISEDGYVGPRTLSDGFVVELRGDDVILPEGMPGGSLKLTRSGIEQSLASGKLRTGRFKVEEAASDSASLLADAQDAAEDTVVQYQPGEYYLSFGRIADSLVYVSMISKSMFDEVVNSYVQRNYRKYRAIKVVSWRVNFSTDAIADFEGLLAVNREICKQQMSEKAPPDVPPYCAVFPILPLRMKMAGLEA